MGNGHEYGGTRNMIRFTEYGRNHGSSMSIKCEADVSLAFGSRRVLVEIPMLKFCGGFGMYSTPSMF